MSVANVSYKKTRQHQINDLDVPLMLQNVMCVACLLDERKGQKNLHHRVKASNMKQTHLERPVDKKNTSCQWMTILIEENNERNNEP